MKSILLTALVSVFAFSSTALADWAEIFTATNAKSGTEEAVVEAFKVGVAPLDIVKLVQQTGGVELAVVVKAFYCAGVPGPTVQAVANDAGLSSLDVTSGYKQSVVQCGPAAALNADPFSSSRNIASRGAPVGGEGRSPGAGGGVIVVPPPVVPPPNASNSR